MTDIAERLEAFASVWPTAYDSDRQNIALLREAAAEIVRLRGEVAALLEDPDEAELAYRCGDPDSDAIAPAEAKDHAPAMPNGVEADWKCIISVLEHGVRDGIHGGYNASYIKQQIKALRAADNRNAAGVCDCPGIGKADKTLHAPNCPVRTAPAAVPALRYTHFQIVTPEGLAPRVGPSAFIEGKYAIQDNRSAQVVAWASERETAVSICYAINNLTGNALGAVRIDDAMIQRGCDAYSAKRMEETGEGESYPEGMQAALTAALQHRGDSQEVGRG